MNAPTRLPTLAQRPDLAAIAAMIEPGSRVLDIGCGDGQLLEFLVATKNVIGRGMEIEQDGVNASVRRGLSVVQGDADEVVDAQAVYAWLETLADPPQLVRMPDTSHFFHRKLIDLRGAIQHEVRRWLPDGSC